MELHKLSLYILLLFGLFAHGYSKKAKPTSPDVGNRGITANFDKIFDQILPFVQKFIKENGMDPMALGGFTENIVPLPGKLQGNINFRNGFLHYMSDLRRTKHVMAQYNDKHLLLDMTLGWSKLDFNYEYDFQHLFGVRRGEVFGRFSDADFNVIIELDFKNYQLTLHKIQSIRISKIDIKFYGHKLDPILNQIVKAVTNIFRNRIIRIIEERSTMIFQPILDNINKWIKKPHREIENFVSPF